MKKTRIGLLVAAALTALTASGWAQDEPPEEGEADVAVEGEAGVEGEGEAGVEGEAGAEAGMEDDPLADEELPEDIPGGEGLDDICEIDPAACPTIDMEKEAARDLPEEIYAVQQRFILKRGRFELRPYWAFTLNDQFVGHPAPGLAINWYISEVLALGVNGQFYSPFNAVSDFNAQVRRSARVAVPLTEYQWGAALNFTYVPADGKFAGFGDFIFHYDAYVVGGVGALSTRPIPIIDPDNRNFQFEPKLAFNAGIGLRIFFSRWLAAVLEVRDYIFVDELENLETAATIEEQQNPDTWMGEKTLTNNVEAHVGISLFIPPSFEYRLPK